MNIQTIEVLDNYRLSIVSDDGKEGVFDAKPFLQYEAFQDLKNLDEFRKVSNGRYYIEWACGADLSADTIEAHLAQ